MDTFWELCYGVRNMLSKQKVDKELPLRDSPISRCTESPTQDSSYNCANIFCMNSVEDLSKWKQVKIKQYNYWLCSQDCWNEWLNSPEYLPWSPLKHFVPIKDPPHLTLE